MTAKLSALRTGRALLSGNTYECLLNYPALWEIKCTYKQIYHCVRPSVSLIFHNWQHLARSQSVHLLRHEYSPALRIYLLESISCIQTSVTQPHWVIRRFCLPVFENYMLLRLINYPYSGVTDLPVWSTNYSSTHSVICAKFACQTDHVLKYRLITRVVDSNVILTLQVQTMPYL
jgi:hypothetical protein